MEKLQNIQEQRKFSGRMEPEADPRKKFDNALAVFLGSFGEDNKFSAKEERKEQQLSLAAFYEALLALHAISEHSDFLGEKESVLVFEKMNALRQAARFWNGKPEVNQKLDLEDIVGRMENQLAQKKQKRVLH